MRVVVVGGGISGLATAWRLQRQADDEGLVVRVSVLEAAARPGGTMRTETVDGFCLEWGPNGFLDSKPSTLRLCADLGIADRLLASDDSARRRFILRGDRLVELPHSPPQFLTSDLLSVLGRLRVIGEMWVRRGDDPDETVAAFARRRLGSQAAERLIDPFVAGIFAGDPERLSVAAAFPRLMELEAKYGSLITASRKLRAERGSDAPSAGPGGKLTSFPNGMGELVEALVEALGDAVRPGVRAERLVREESGWAVHTAGGHRYPADAVILATPAFASARALRDVDAAAADALEAIPYAPVAVTLLAYPTERVGHDLDGFGFLIPAVEDRPILGCLWTSSIFPGQRAPKGHALVRVMMGGRRRPELLALDDAALLRIATDQLTPILGLEGAPALARVVRHERAIPQYEVGHLSRVAALTARLATLDGVFATGNALRGVGVNDCTLDAEAVAATALQWLRARASGASRTSGGQEH